MKKIRGLRWYMVGLVTLGTVLGYLSRNTVAVAVPELHRTLDLTTQQYGYIVAVYSACYTVMQPVAGYVLDMLGTRLGYGLFAIIWALACMSTVFAGSWQGIAIARGAGGAAESAMIPAGLKATSEWFPAKERAKAVGWFNVGSSIGAMLAPPLVVMAIMLYSWRAAFLACGALSLIWAAVWLINYRKPAEHKLLSVDEHDYISAGQESDAGAKRKTSVLGILSNRQFWGIAVPRFLAEPAWGTLNSWIPLFMHKAYGFDLKSIALFAWMPMLFADVGSVLGGYMPGFFQRHFGVTLINSRRLVVTLGAFLMIGPGIIGLFTSPYIAIAMLCIGGFAHQSLSGSLITLSADVFGKNEVATANGLTGMAAWSASTMFALVVGALADTLGFSPLFMVLACFDLLAATAVWMILRDPERRPRAALASQQS